MNLGSLTILGATILPMYGFDHSVYLYKIRRINFSHAEWFYFRTRHYFVTVCRQKRIGLKLIMKWPSLTWFADVSWDWVSLMDGWKDTSTRVPLIVCVLLSTFFATVIPTTHKFRTNVPIGGQKQGMMDEWIGGEKDFQGSKKNVFILFFWMFFFFFLEPRVFRWWGRRTKKSCNLCYVYIR